MTLGLTDPLDFASDVPVYGQIRNRLTFAIARGAFRPENQLPSVRQLARLLVVNPNTVIRVYRELELEGLTFTHPGKGVFVAPGAEERCRRVRQAIVEEKLREALALARRASLDGRELDELWARLKDESKSEER
jgi:GntR family transcriptional regulator